jgi:hypothetical protein
LAGVTIVDEARGLEAGVVGPAPLDFDDELHPAPTRATTHAATARRRLFVVLMAESVTH